jgi:hypothetical protein
MTSSHFEKIKSLCDQALARLMLARRNHELGVPEDLSLPMVDKVIDEVDKMRAALSSKIFTPTYGRFIIDWPDEHGLIKILSDLSYEYCRFC